MLVTMGGPAVRIEPLVPAAVVLAGLPAAAVADARASIALGGTWLLLGAPSILMAPAYSQPYPARALFLFWVLPSVVFLMLGAVRATRQPRLARSPETGTD
jgi:hypothetical protein